MKEPEIVRILNVIKRAEQRVASGDVSEAVQRHLAVAKCTYWRMRKLRVV